MLNNLTLSFTRSGDIFDLDSDGDLQPQNQGDDFDNEIFLNDDYFGSDLDEGTEGILSFCLFHSYSTLNYVCIQIIFYITKK